MTKRQARALNGASQKGILITLGVTVTAGVLGASQSAENAVQILGFCSLVCVSLLGLLAQIRTVEKLEVVAEKAEVAAVKVEEVKTALVEKDVKTESKLDSIHSLVDGAMSNQLRISWVALKRVAELTKLPEDIAVAEIAEKLWHEQEAKHIAEQAKNKEPIP